MRPGREPSAGTVERRSLRLGNEHYDYRLRLNNDVRQYRLVRHPLGRDTAESGTHREQAGVGPGWRGLREVAVSSGEIVAKVKMGRHGQRVTLMRTGDG